MKRPEFICPDFGSSRRVRKDRSYLSGFSITPVAGFYVFVLMN
jgi:hypothetical protein